MREGVLDSIRVDYYTEARSHRIHQGLVYGIRAGRIRVGPGESLRTLDFKFRPSKIAQFPISTNDSFFQISSVSEDQKRIAYTMVAKAVSQHVFGG